MFADIGSYVNMGRTAVQDLYGFYRDKEADNQLQHAEDMAHAQDARNWERQKEFAQMGIQWRVDDARKAGLHPVFALGGGGAAYSPGAISVGDTVSNFGGSGQNLSRAAMATMTPEERYTKQLENSVLVAQADKFRSEAELNRSQIQGSSRLGGSQLGPVLPSATLRGDGLMLGSDQAKTNPAEGISVDPLDFSQTAHDPSPLWERFVTKDAGGKDTVVWLPSSGKGAPTEALESLGENYGLLYATIQENLRRDPELIYKMRHMYPGGELIAEIAAALERSSQYFLNRRKGRAAAIEMMRGWNKSGRDRGVNWRSGKGGD